MRESILSVVVCVLAIFVSGCLEFDEQTVYIEHDQANDRLILIFDYMGLFAAENDNHAAPPSVEEIEESEKQLAEAVRLRKFALLDTWPLALSVQEVREALLKPDEDMPADVRDLLGGVLDEITVRNGGFYTDGAGRLCGAQVVVVEHVSRVMSLLNQIINRLIVEEAADANDEVERLAADLARSGQTWVSLNGHALQGVFPVPETYLQEGRREFAKEQVDTFRKAVLQAREDGEGRRLEVVLGRLHAALAGPILVWHEDNLLRVRVGYCSMPSELPVLPVMGDYRPNLEEHVTATYGLQLDQNVARYLLDPDALAATEELEAARLMAPRLTPGQRARVLVHALESAPTDALRAELREEPLPKGIKVPAGQASDAELLALWRGWLAARPVPRAKE